MSNVPMTLQESAFSIQARPFNHSSTFVELADGRILHVSNRVREWSEDGGLTWSQTWHEDQWMVDTNGDPVGGTETSLVKLSGKNEIGLAARLLDESFETEYAMPFSGSHFKFWRSKDGGETWSPPVRMSPPGLITAGLHDTLLRTSTGRIVLPVFIRIGQRSGPDDRIIPMSGKLVHNQFVGTAGHFFDSQFHCNYVLYSDDDGRSWQMNKDGALIILLDWNAMFSYSNEASVTEVKPGRLLMMMRNCLGRLFQAWSNDNGETWTRPQPTVLASSTCPAQIRTLPNGHLLCVWNQETEQEIRAGYNRTRISTAISRDGGRVWEYFQNIYSMHETTRVEPGPIRPTRPQEIYFSAGQPAPQRDPRYVLNCDQHIRGSYPSCFVMKDRVIVTHTVSGEHEEHSTQAQLVNTGTGEKHPETGDYMHQSLKVLPLKWFYGGKEPVDNPFLREAYEPANP
jgi:hypothetical protein